MSQRRLRAAAEAYATTRDEYRAAEEAANAAYRQLEASPDTLEFQIDWSEARKREAAAAWRMKDAEKALREAGGYARVEPGG